MESSRELFLTALQDAVNKGTGFAAGKLGYSEQVWLSSQWSLELAADDPRLQRAIRTSARFHATMQAGAFPDSDDYLDTTVKRLAESATQMDFLAVHNSPLVEPILEQLTLQSGILPFKGLEPNRDVPYNSNDCYLPFLRGKRILLITTPAQLLVDRANQETFEKVWANIQCPWFYPESVEALSFDSLFDSKTRATFATSTELLDSLCKAVAQKEFDVALVGASSLGLPLVDYIKSLGKIGLSLGGHLQVIFGVQGKRWRDDPRWQSDYWNDSWIDMPENFKPNDRKWLVDDGAYW